MNECYVVITARSRTDHNESSTSVSQGDFCGLIAGVIAKICLGMNVRTLKSECFEKDGHLALIMRADAGKISTSLDHLRTALSIAGEKMNTVIRVQKEDLFRYMHRI